MFRKRRWLIIGGLILAQVGVIACYQGFLHGSSQAAAVGCCANEQPQAAAPSCPPTAARSAPVAPVDKKTELTPASFVFSEPPVVQGSNATLPLAEPAPVVTPTELPQIPEAPSENQTPVAENAPLPVPPPLAVEPPPPPSIPVAQPPVVTPPAPQAEWKRPIEVTAPPTPPAPISPPPLPEPQVTAPPPPPDVVVHPVVPAAQPQMPTPLPPVSPVSMPPPPPAGPLIPAQALVPASNTTTTPVAPPAEKPLPAGPCPWTLKMTVVDGLTVMEARIDKEIQFRIVCEKLDLASPRGSINAQGDVKISGSGLDGHCQKLLINWHDDHILVEGDAYLKCLREGHDVELTADRLSLRLSQSSSIKGLGKVKPTSVEEVSEPHESRIEPVKAPAKPPTPIRAE